MFHRTTARSRRRRKSPPSVSRRAFRETNGKNRHNNSESISRSAALIPHVCIQQVAIAISVLLLKARTGWKSIINRRGFVINVKACLWMETSMYRSWVEKKRKKLGKTLTYLLLNFTNQYNQVKTHRLPAIHVQYFSVSAGTIILIESPIDGTIYIGPVIITYRPEVEAQLPRRICHAFIRRVVGIVKRDEAREFFLRYSLQRRYRRACRAVVKKPQPCVNLR